MPGFHIFRGRLPAAGGQTHLLDVFQLGADLFPLVETFFGDEAVDVLVELAIGRKRGQNLFPAPFGIVPALEVAKIINLFGEPVLVRDVLLEAVLFDASPTWCVWTSWGRRVATTVGTELRDGNP